MKRAILGVMVGFIIAGAVIFGGMIAAAAIMGPDGMYEEGSYAVTSNWLVMSFVLGLFAAVLGGLACAFIAARGSGAPMALAAILLIWGIPNAVYQTFMIERTDPPARDAQAEETMLPSEFQRPVISLWLDPIIGATGVLIGGRLAGRRGGRVVAEPDVGPEPHAGD